MGRSHVRDGPQDARSRPIASGQPGRPADHVSLSAEADARTRL